MKKNPYNPWGALRYKVIICVVGAIVVLSLAFNFIIYSFYKNFIISSIQDEALIVYEYVDSVYDSSNLPYLNSAADMDTEAYQLSHEHLIEVPKITNTAYMFLVKENPQGELIYITNSFDESQEGFIPLGAPFVSDVSDAVYSCMAGDEIIWDQQSTLFRWNSNYFILFPIHGNGEVMAALGMEFDTGHLRLSFIHMQLMLAGLSMAVIVAAGGITVTLLRRALGDTEQILDRVLSASSKVSKTLMTVDDVPFVQTVSECLGIIGESVYGDYAFLWKHTEQWDKSVFSRYDYYWKDSKFDHIDTPPFVLECSKPYPDWKQALDNGEVLIGITAQMHNTMGESMLARGVKQTILAPIIVNGALWGCLGVGNFAVKDQPTESMGRSVQSCGLLLASAILHRESVQALVAAREEALASTKAKTSFLSRMSHEIRTPINAITGMTLVAQKSNDIPKMHYCLDKIESASTQLLDIINDVLDMSKIEADQFELSLHEFNLDKMLQRVFNVVQIKADDKGQNLRFMCDEVFTRNIISDELRLSQVLINLLGNAVKFTPNGGDVVLRIQQIKQEGDASVLRIAVEDNGIGISEEQRSKLFNAFEQADGSITRKYGGTGLGLSICKKIVELMGGSIWVESDPGHGSRFLFDISVRWGEDCLLETIEYIPTEDLRILVVDDDPDVLEYFRSVLDTFSLGCDAVLRGGDAIRMAEENAARGTPYHIVFLDWVLPDESGIDVARAIKQVLSHNSVVIMISATSWEDIREEVIPLGIDHFLAKPVLPSTLLNTLVKLTGRQLMSDESEQHEDIYHWQDRRILLAEDIEINQEILVSILEDTGVAIDIASDGRQAVELFVQNSGAYDLILMDIQMPHMDGLSAAREIRASAVPMADSIPIFAMTANAFKDDIVECLKAGMNGHIAKPLDVEELFSTLETSFRSTDRENRA